MVMVTICDLKNVENIDITKKFEKVENVDCYKFVVFYNLEF
jgi:hypothetical protein